MNGIVIHKYHAGIEAVDLTNYHRIKVTRSKRGKVKLRLFSNDATVKNRTIKFTERSEEEYQTFLQGVAFLASSQEGKHLTILHGRKNEEASEGVTQRQEG